MLKRNQNILRGSLVLCDDKIKTCCCPLWNPSVRALRGLPSAFRARNWGLAAVVTEQGSTGSIRGRGTKTKGEGSRLRVRYSACSLYAITSDRECLGIHTHHRRLLQTKLSTASCATTNTRDRIPPPTTPVVACAQAQHLLVGFPPTAAPHRPTLVLQPPHHHLFCCLGFSKPR